MKRPLIGAHVSFKQKTQLLGTLQDLYTIGATSGAIYISNSRAYKKTLILDEKNLKEAHEFAKKINFNIENIIIHSPLIGNLANDDEDLKIFNATVYSYTEDVKLMEKMGLKYFNFHPGSFRKKDRGINRCAIGINKIIEKTKDSKVILCLETMMGKGNYIGRNFWEIKEIINLVENKKRIGVVIDTCHIWDAGYDIRNIDKVLEEFNNIIGLNYLKGMHINDSKNGLGSNKDRHANIGKGEIGLEALRKIVFHPNLINLPKALETPYGKDDFKRWKEEISLLIN